jgi:hypothetical protein
MRGFFDCAIHDEVVNGFAQNDGSMVRMTVGVNLSFVLNNGSLLVVSRGCLSMLLV